MSETKPVFTDSDIDDILEQLRHKAEAEAITHNLRLSAKTQRIIQLIEYLRTEKETTVASHRSFGRKGLTLYIVDFQNRTIAHALTQSAAAKLCGVATTTISTATLSKRPIHNGRYVITHDREEAVRLLRDGPVVTPPRRTLGRVVVSSRQTGKIVKIFTRMMDFARAYDLHRSTVYSMEKRRVAGVPQQVHGQMDLIARFFFKPTVGSKDNQ